MLSAGLILDVAFLFVLTNYLGSSDQCFDDLMSGFLPTCCAASFLLFLSAPTLSQPQLAIPIRTFPPGVQVDSPVPINRGHDALGLEGFQEPEKGNGFNKLTEVTTSSTQGDSGGSSSGSDSMFGYEDEGAKSVFAEQNKNEMGLNAVDSTMRANDDNTAEDTDVFGSEMEDDCSKVTASSFCSAFN